MTVSDTIALFAMLFTGGIFLLALLTFFGSIINVGVENNLPQPFFVPVSRQKSTQ
ncbi:hypothetical protein [Listeria booriae]|uniref:hypothetical protein n=1 Tax=Listeria booriae TaxID=1552123 RepID=UPI00162584F2|nr:hypothetical protein [Listeria booriae]MBC2323748.1 hypothetical protein [Listeria booriae]